MNLDYILKEIRNYSESIFDYRVIEDVPEFKEGSEVVSMESLMLQVGGHSPIKEYRFSEKKLAEWCRENNIDHYYDRKERLYHFKNG